MAHTLQFITYGDWAKLTTSEGFEMYDEWQMSKNAYEKVKSAGKLEKKDLSVLEPLYNQMNKAWEMAMKTNNHCNVLKDMINKYQNSYEFPQKDFKTICDIVDDYLVISETTNIDSKLKQNYCTLVNQRLVYLHSKILMPELMVKYPVIFK